jgi:hypothetical protein
MSKSAIGKSKLANERWVASLGDEGMEEKELDHVSSQYWTQWRSMHSLSSSFGKGMREEMKKN